MFCRERPLLLHRVCLCVPLSQKREREKFASSTAEESGAVGKKIGTINLGFSLQKSFSRSRLFLSRRMMFFSSSSRASIYIFYFVLTYYCYYVLGFRA